jgi:ABC-type transport system involved in multi-copper enzyme maturation permease subunit
LRARNLVRKELAELAASRAWWLLLVVVGLLTGQAFIGAVRTYAEMSAPTALAQGLSPLDGIVVPTLGAYDLAIMLLFPFVAIRLVANERSTDALKIVLQWPVTRSEIVLTKLGALMAAWLVALVPFAIAMGLWIAYGGHLNGVELANVVLGYTLRFLLTAGLSMAAAALLPGAANAAVAVLAFTIGTWALDFLAAGRGGFLQKLATYTPAAVLRSFERGLFRVDVALVLCIVILAALAITAIAIDLGSDLRSRSVRIAVVCIVAVAASVGAANVHTSFDLSENRRSSFSPTESRALGSIAKPLDLTIWLSPEDPRLADLETNTLVKLRRSMSVHVAYPLEGRSALFENDDRYGTIEYRLGGKQAVNRSTTEAIVLETIFALAGMSALPPEESLYPGYPLRAQPRGAGAVFYLVWPVFTLAVAWRLRRGSWTLWT